jgi:nitrite reductase/ring-hydroxylating ferredoxin subunit
MANWVTVGEVGDVPEGGLSGFTAGDRAVAIANVGGDLHAFDDVCTHQQCSLSEGELEGTVVQCPCHGSQFDVTSGEVVNGPAADPVDVFDLREENGEIQVRVE